MKPSASRSESSVRCPRCGNSFDCGRHAQPFDCWCREMSTLSADRLDPASKCVCPECLAAEIAKAVAQPGSGTGGNEGL
ncbi:cysteine-rich CWC family protein [Paraburkholderia sp. GAS333]|uniref:cysteine-rich CWC family protein n=1 Tax=Paraburkholderia sp. GAS333 TaxID=3156279 RepID=UPI003D20205F